MSSTYLSLHYHLVFSTKHRKPTIHSDWRARLHNYLGGTVDGLQGFAQGIGGTEDHVHLLVGLKSTHSLADFMRELKKSSSMWVHEELKGPEFEWQEGYAAFTVSPSARAGVKKYIANQEQHHHQQSFREELIELLEQAGVEYMMSVGWIECGFPPGNFTRKALQYRWCRCAQPPAKGFDPCGIVNSQRAEHMSKVRQGTVR